MNPALKQLYISMLSSKRVKITQAKERIEVTVIYRLYLSPLVIRFYIGDEAVKRGGKNIVYCYHLEGTKPNCKCHGVSARGHLYGEDGYEQRYSK